MAKFMKLAAIAAAITVIGLGFSTQTLAVSKQELRDAVRACSKEHPGMLCWASKTDTTLGSYARRMGLEWIKSANKDIPDNATVDMTVSAGVAYAVKPKARLAWK